MVCAPCLLVHACRLRVIVVSMLFQRHSVSVKLIHVHPVAPLVQKALFTTTADAMFGGHFAAKTHLL